MKFFSLIYQGDLHPSTDQKVLKTQDYSTLVNALEVLEKAHEDAASLHKNTEIECRTLKEEATEAGFQKGLEDFNEKILYLDKEMKNLRHNLQQMVLPIALKAAKRIICKELEMFPETIVDIVANLLESVADSQKVVLFVNKEDKAHLDAEKPRLKEILQYVDLFTIQEKADIKPGGCIIHTPKGTINATLENQLLALERAFEKYKQTT